MFQELVTLFSRVHFMTDDSRKKKVPAKHVAALNAEISLFGYTFDADLATRLRNMAPADFAVLRTDLLKLVVDASGGSYAYRTLFNRFPYDTPEHWDYLVSRVIGYAQTALGLRPNQARMLSCGHVVDDRLFDLSNFGACPVCQFQVPELSSFDDVRHEFASVTPYKVLSYADDDFVRGRANALLARHGSLSAAERAFLFSARPLGGLERPNAVYRENLPFIYAFFGDVEYTRSLLSGATDVMRIAAYLSDQEADLSLKAPVRFKFSTRHKKNLLSLLEDLDNLEEDMMRHRERWLRLGEIINPGSARNARRFPKTAAAFHKLRNEPKSIPTFNRTVEGKIRAGSIDADLLAILADRPGEFMRRLDVLLRRAKDPDAVLDTLRAVAGKCQTGMLFALNKHLLRRAFSDPTDRIFFPKGQLTKVKVIEDNRGSIALSVISAAVDIIASTMYERFSQLETMGKVYIDPRLKEIVMPFNRRGDSSTNVAVIKGSRYPMGEESIIRLFAWWKGPVDVDLSAVFCDEDLNQVGLINYYDTRGYGCIHSGDIRNAPNGAAEFIDIDIDRLLKDGARYVVTSVISFRGDGFENFPCFAGYMERDDLSSGAKFEPESVAIKFDINGKTTSVTPLIFDLKERKVIFVDLAGGRRTYDAVHRAGDHYAVQLQAVLDLPATKPTVHDVLTAHASARGTIVREREGSDLVFDLDTLNIEAIVSMMD